MTYDIRGLIQPVREPETPHQQEIRLAVEKERKEIIAIGERIKMRATSEVTTSALRDLLNALRNR